MVKKKPNDYWRDFEKVKKELEPIIKKLGYFPSSIELREIRLTSVVAAIAKYHGGMDNARKLIGYSPLQKPSGYWKDFGNVKKELISMINGLGHFPTSEEFRERGLSSLVHSIVEYHGGVNKMREELGYNINRKSPGYWKDSKKIKKEISLIIQKLGYFPTQKEFSKLGKGYLVDAIHNHYGGLNKLRKKMGYKQIHESIIHLQSLHNLKSELQPIIKELGHFPASEELKKKGVSRLYRAMSAYYGGINEVRKIMGYELPRKPENYWKDLKNVTSEIEGAIKEVRYFPSIGEFYRIGLRGMVNAINKYHGGMNKVRKRIGYSPLQKPSGYWKEFNNIKKELEPIIKKLGRFPTQKEILRNKGSGLEVSIYLYHGGLKKVRELMGYPPSNGKIRSEKSLVDLLDTDEKARRVVERFGGDIGDIADILSVVYEGRLSQEDAAKLVAKPSVRAYLGRFKRPIGGIGELAEISNELLPHDKNEVIQGILYRKVNEYIYQKCGPYPSKEKRQALLNEFELELGRVGGNGKGQL